MNNWLLMVSTLFAAIAGINGTLAVHRGDRSRFTAWWMIATFVLQFAFLVGRGQLREACPLRDPGELLIYLSWSLTLFYLLIGPAYRISLLGVFTAPVVVVFQLTVLVGGLLEPKPTAALNTDPWQEVHSATSVLAYGALALAGVAGVMFLVLDRQLKIHALKSSLFRNLPPVRDLLKSTVRLLWLGWILLSIGIVAGTFTLHIAAPLHLQLAAGVWLAYASLIGVHTIRGITGRRLSWLAVILFVLSLGVFAVI